MKNIVLVLAICLLGIPVVGKAEILAMSNYESKPEDSLKELKMPFGTQTRREGIAIFDVDPESDTYGDILIDIPLPSDLVAHHVFWNRDHTKIYLTALGKPELRVIDMTRNPYRVKVIDVPDCEVGEDVVFSEDNTRWYETCMGSSVVVMGDAVNDTYTKTIQSNVPYPHGIAIHEGIDRMLVTSTVRATDLQDAGEVIGVLEASTGKPLSQIRVSDKPSPSGEAPVEIVWVPHSNPPVAWITNMYGGTLWTLTWNPEKGDFEADKGFDFAGTGAGVPLEIAVWTHVAMVRTSDILIKIYIDGALDSEGETYPSAGGAASATRIGAWTAGRHNFDGFIDEVKIWNRVLDEDEIQQSMGTSIAVNPSEKTATKWAELKKL